ncbi:hypothetical protein HDU67_000972, partial [Dinochytrium kinnereticum]
MEAFPDDENSTIPADPADVIVHERNYNLLLWMPFILIPTLILSARAIKYLYRIYQAKKLLSFSETEEKRELTIVALSFCNFIFLSASVINALETLHVDKRVNATLTTWHDSLYYIMVTFSTIGFGDLTPSTIPSRVVVMFLIIIVIVYVPFQTSRIVEIFSATSAYQRARHKSSTSRPHVILTGQNVHYAVLIDFCREFMSASAASSSTGNGGGGEGGGVAGFGSAFLGGGKGGGTVEDSVHVVVVLTPGMPCLETRRLLRHPFYRNRIKFLSGSAMSLPDLCRADAERATALFILGGGGGKVGGGGETGGDEEGEELRLARTSDASVLMQSLVAKKAYPGMMVISQVTDARSEELSSKCGSDRTLCLESIKMGILARDCIVPGFLALVTNLVTTYRDEVGAVEDRLDALRRKTRASKKVERKGGNKGFRGEEVDDDDEDEEEEPLEVRRVREYRTGAVNQIYSLRVPPGLARVPFREATELIYGAFAVTLIGIISSTTQKVQLNP